MPYPETNQKRPGTTRITAGNDTPRTGRPNGQGGPIAGSGRSQTSDHYPSGDSRNETAGAGRLPSPLTTRGYPSRQQADQGAGDVTDISADRVYRSKE